MGGQVADTGTIVAEDATIVAEVTDVKKHRTVSSCILLQSKRH